MKVRKIIGVVLVCIAAVSGLLYSSRAIYVYRHRKELKTGKYLIQNNSDYPDACIEVRGKQAIIKNIDLNAVYKQAYVDEYLGRMERKNGKMTKTEKVDLSDSIDLNRMFTQQSFDLDYKSYFMEQGKTKIAIHLGSVFTGVYFPCIYDYDKNIIFLSGYEEEYPISFQKE